MVAACLKMCIFSVGKVRPKDWVRNRSRIRIWRQEIFGPWDIDERERLRKEDLLTLYHEQLQSVAAQEALATRKAEASRILTARGAGACVPSVEFCRQPKSSAGLLLLAQGPSR
jgi:hypothetical protein